LSRRNGEVFLPQMEDQTFEQECPNAHKAFLRATTEEKGQGISKAKKAVSEALRMYREQLGDIVI
jgi:hypothetical protein